MISEIEKMVPSTLMAIQIEWVGPHASHWFDGLAHGVLAGDLLKHKKLVGEVLFLIDILTEKSKVHIEDELEQRRRQA